MRRFRLRATLPLALLGELPLVDESARPGHPTAASAIRGLSEFLVDCSSTRPLVLEFPGRDPADPLLAALRERLIPEGRRRRVRGCVLVVVESRS